MKILFLSSTDNVGGAGILAFKLAENLEKTYSCETVFLVGKKFSNRENVTQTRGAAVWFIEKVFEKFLSFLGFQYAYIPFSSRRILKEIKKFKPDIIHINNIHGGYIDLRTLSKILKSNYVVWTFHDMFNFTGHCAHSFDCLKWMDGCGKCPALWIPPKIGKDSTRKLLKAKKETLNVASYKIVTPSAWLKACVEQSILSKQEIRLIYNGIDKTNFERIDKIEARKRLELPKDKTIVLFSANNSYNNPFKGSQFVKDICSRFRDSKDVLFVNVGGEIVGSTDNEYSFVYVDCPKKMAEIYSASDILLFPTLAEVFGLVVAEAMACGLPVVTFDTGGVPEIVRHMKDGYVAEKGNLQDLILGMELLLNKVDMRDEMSRSALKRVSGKFDILSMTKEYYDLYLETLK